MRAWRRRVVASFSLRLWVCGGPDPAPKNRFRPEASLDLPRAWSILAIKLELFSRGKVKEGLVPWEMPPPLNPKVV
jgi:hypothetical protein